MSSARRLTGAAGRWSATHPWTAIIAWLGCVAVLLVAGHLAGTIQLSNPDQSVGQDGQGEHMIASDFTQISAGVVTAAAVVMVFVFLTFATLSMVEFKEMGVGLAVAVLLDATIVRALLLPATMKLLGPRNWYLPRWLEWLPQISHSVPPPPTGPLPRQPVPAGRP